MNNLEEALNNLKVQLDNNPVVQEYLKLKEAYENDPELKEMRSEIARLTDQNKNEEHDALLEVYNSHPVVINYNQAREELISLLSQIKDILSD